MIEVAGFIVIFAILSLASYWIGWINGHITGAEREHRAHREGDCL